ncbi:hypothetical protein PIB30_058035 [Stylosanthes scabra]|uniref:Uncharacterized protein n=1 Tax=Stylosanthes scabra TaxID=79078 RepID=A0ABU6VI21_9FABA|nr:hypothetical protein [Stylosanthes scabra]
MKVSSPSEKCSAPKHSLALRVVRKRYTDDKELYDAVHMAILTLKEGYGHAIPSLCTK